MILGAEYFNLLTSGIWHLASGIWHLAMQLGLGSADLQSPSSNTDPRDVRQIGLPTRGVKKTGSAGNKSKANSRAYDR